MKPLLSHEEILQAGKKFSQIYRVDNGGKFRLKDFPTSDVDHLPNRDEATHWRARSFLDFANNRMAELQDKLYAQKQHSLLIVFQAMDAAGKDGTIKHVMSGVNPQGCEVVSFKAPSDEERAHTFLWRCAKRVPEAGKIGIFNRSHYEDVLVQRVHPDFLKTQYLPPERITKKIWQERYEDINAFEKHLINNGVVILKFYLHMSKKEQKKRFMKRINEVDKNWKFSESDIKERALWDEYMTVYEEAIRATAKPWAPWYVVPADQKWYMRGIVATAIIDALETINPQYPDVSEEHKKMLKDAHSKLNKEK